MPNLKAACIDISVVSSYSNLTDVITHPEGYNANIAAKRKCNKYEARCKAQGYDFIPLVMESAGGFNKSADIVFKAIGKAISEKDGIQLPLAIANLKQNYSFMWQSMFGSALISQYRNSFSG